MWDFLLPAFKGTKIRPMDFDAVVERKGHVLIFETKDPDKEVEKGQRITLTNEWRRGSSILYIKGKTPDTITHYASYGWWNLENGVEFGCLPLREANQYDVLYWVRCWFCVASKLPVPTRQEWDEELSEVMENEMV